MSAKIKRTNDELKASRPTEEEVTKIPRLPISILVENVRSVHNVGSIFRSADGFGANKIYLTGYTACPPREDISKTALGADKVVPWEHYKNPIEAAKLGCKIYHGPYIYNFKEIYDLLRTFKISEEIHDGKTLCDKLTNDFNNLANNPLNEANRIDELGKKILNKTVEEISLFLK